MKRRSGAGAKATNNRRALLLLLVGVVVLAGVYLGTKVLNKHTPAAAPPAAGATTATTAVGHPTTKVVHRPKPSGPAPSYTRNPFATGG